MAERSTGGRGGEGAERSKAHGGVSRSTPNKQTRAHGASNAFTLPRGLETATSTRANPHASDIHRKALLETVM